MLVDTGSSWLWVDSDNSDKYKNSIYVLSENNDVTLDCSSGDRKEIVYGGGSFAVEGPVCEDYV